MTKAILTKAEPSMQQPDETSSTGSQGTEWYIVEINDKYKRGGDYEGTLVTTNRADIFLVISTWPQCCESWGYECETPEGRDMTGARITDVYLPPDDYEENTENRTVRMIIETTFGNVVLSVHNEHNGFYPHRIMFGWKEGQCEEQDI